MTKLSFTLQALPQVLLNEIDITSRLLHSNASSSFAVLFGGLIPRMSSVAALHDPAGLILKAFTAALTYAYCFDICNQTMSVEEDLCNRPSRPIPAGVLTVEGARRRWVLAWLFASPVFYVIGGLKASLHMAYFLAWTFICYVWPKPNDWLFKSLFTAVGNFLLLRILNALMVRHASHSEMSIGLDILHCIWLLFTIHVQDFHDIEGDRKTGRRTLPTILHPLTMSRVRIFTTAVLVSTSTAVATSQYWAYSHEMALCTTVFAVLQLLGGCATGIRVLRTETADQAEKTYKHFYMMTALLLESYFSMVNYSMERREAK